MGILGTEGTASRLAFPQKAIAAAMSAVLALGLSPIGQAPAQAWAEGDQVPTETTEQAEQTEQSGETGAAAKALTLGDDGYDSLAGAVKALDSFDGKSPVITLNEDVTETSMITVTKNVAIDLNGHTLTVNTAANYIFVTGDATLTMKGEKKDSKYLGGIAVGQNTNNNGHVVIDGGEYQCVNGETVVHVNGTCKESNVTISGAKLTSPTDNGVQFNGYGVFSVTDSEITGYTGLYMKGGKLTLENATVKGTRNYTSPTPNINGSNATGDAIVLDTTKEYPGGMEVTLKGDGNVIESAYGNGIHEDVLKGDASTVLSIKVEGGTVTGSADEGKKALAVSDKFEKTKVSLTGGTFSSDVEYFLTEGYGQYAVSGGYRVAKRSAISTVADGGTVTTTVGDASVKEALAGQEVKVSAAPHNGYYLDSLTAATADGEDVAIEGGAFAMPAAPVTVTAVFKEYAAPSGGSAAAPATEEAKAAEQAIETLPAAADVSVDDAKAVEDARAAYDALTDEEKAQVPAAEVEALVAAEAALASAKAVDSAASELAGVDASSAASVEEALAAYEALTDEEKAKVPADLVRDLEYAQEALANLSAGDEVSDVTAAAGSTVDIAATSKSAVTVTGSDAKSGATLSLNSVVLGGKTYKVTAVGAKAFKGTKAKKVTLGANVTKLGAGAFQNAKKLTAFTLGKNVKTVGKNVLKGATSLKTVTLKSGKLTKASLQNLLKGSKVKTVKLSGVSKKAKANYKKWAPKGVTVK